MTYSRLLLTSFLLPLLGACNFQLGDSSTAGSGGAGGSCPSGPVLHITPPAPGPNLAPTGAGHATFAIRTLLLGDQDRDGQLDAEDAWRQYGFDLDGIASTTCTPSSFAGLCRPLSGADPKEVQPDGDGGIDNAFGKLVLPLLRVTSPDLTSNVASDLAHGGSALLIDLEGLGSGDARPLTARLYDGAPLGKTPAYDGTDAWPVWPGSLTDPSDLASATLQSAASYVVDDTWVGRFQGDLTLRLPLNMHNILRLRIHDPVLTMHLDAARKTATLGTLAGVVAVSDATSEAGDALSRANVELCADQARGAILKDVEQAADILLDGTQSPGKDCEAISIGLGFTAARVQLGAIAAPEVLPGPPDCPGVGTPDGGAPDGG